MVFVGTIVSIITLFCVKDKYPLNMLTLFVFTLLESYTVGVICSRYNVESILVAFILTFGITVSLSIYALTSKRDFSSWGAGLYSVLMCFVLGSLIQLFIPFNSVLHLAISIGGAILFSLFIIYDTDQIQKRLSPDEYIIGAI